MENTFTLTGTNKSAIANCFLWMFLGLGATAISALVSVATGLSHNLPVIVIMGIVTTVTAILMGVFRNKMSSTMMKVSFGIYSVSMGAFLGILTETYKLGSIGSAFMVSSVLFLCIFLTTKFTKMDFTKIGTISLIGLVVLMISELVLFLLHVPFMTLVFAAIALVLFLGITAYDVQRANKILSEDCLDEEDLDKMSIYFALQLHLDFINIFIRVLEIIANKN